MAVVIDTNVWQVAAGQSAQADEQCLRACTGRLDSLRHEAILAVDEGWEILGEYFRLPPQSAPRLILAELLRRSDRIEFRACRPGASGSWPLPDSLAPLHSKDHKFAAVALTYDPPAPIYNAVDKGWQDCKAATDAAGLEVNELCPQCLR